MMIYNVTKLIISLFLMSSNASAIGLTKPELEKFVDNKVKFTCEHRVTGDSSIDSVYNGKRKYKLEITQISEDHFMNYKDVYNPYALFVVNVLDAETQEKLHEFEAEGARRITDKLTFEDTTKALQFNFGFTGLPEGYGLMTLNGNSRPMTCKAEVLPEPQAVTAENYSVCDLDKDPDCVAVEASTN